MPKGSGSNIKSSMDRCSMPSYSYVDGFAPQNGHKGLVKDTAGKNTKNITKSTSVDQAGPRTNNL